MQLAPFLPIGNAFIVTTAGANTSQSTLLDRSSLNIPSANPSQVRLLNKGTVDIWVSFTGGAATAVIPTAGSTTTGTPQAMIFIEPGVDLILSFNGSLPCYLNTIASSGAQNLQVQFGEGA